MSGTRSLAPVGPGPSAPGHGMAYPEYPHDDLWDALREVGDPEMGISLVDMGMIVAARRDGAEGERAHIELTYTSMGCPATEMIDEDIRARLSRVPGVRDVEIEIVWEPVWTKARLTIEARDALLLLGVSV
ncbi:MAG: metal-sulfur cluster assembly factor [Ktedonobacterales bacterium]